MTLSIQSTLPTRSGLSGLAPPGLAPPGLVPRESVNTGAPLAPLIGSAQVYGPALATAADFAERFGLTTANNTAQALREQAASVAANTIHWTPWHRAYSSRQKWPGNWINTSI